MSHIKLPEIKAPDTSDGGEPKVKRVNIVGMGESRSDWLSHVLSDHDSVRDVKTWTIGPLGAVLRGIDRIFWTGKFDAAAPINQRLCDVARKENIPLYVSEPMSGFENQLKFPREEIVKALGHNYINNSVAEAFVMAVYEGYTHIGLFGCDFDYPGISAHEPGRGCLEYWCGVAAAKGVRVAIAANSTLMDMNVLNKPKE